MCFHNIKVKEKAKVAKKDIKVYKWLQSHWDNSLRSPIQSTRWEVKKLGKARLLSEVRRGMVDSGFHSYKSKRHAINIPYAGDLYSFIIPKGSKYYVNKTQYVSNRMYLLTGKPLKS